MRVIELTPESAAWLAAASEAEPLHLVCGWAIAVVTRQGRRAVLHAICGGWAPAPALWPSEAEAWAWLREQRPDLAPADQHPRM